MGNANGGILIKGGTVIDPSRGINGVMDVFALGGRIEDPLKVSNPDHVIDAGGCVVTPGLIDFHCHFFNRGTEIGVTPDNAFLPQGVTGIVDMGSAGISNFESFYESVMASCQMRTFAYLNVCRTGLVTTKYPENLDPAFFDQEKIAMLLNKYQDCLLGLKIRQSKEIVGPLGIEPLKATLKIAGELNCSVAVHTTNPPCEIGEIASILRKGDIFSHVFQGKGSNIVDEAGKIRPEIREAQSRGVFFDTADGRAHSCMSVIRAALNGNFFPDTLSTDQTRGNLFDPCVFGLPMIMSKYLEIGYPLENVVASCTSIPAKILGMQGKLGTLQQGAFADIAVFRMKPYSRDYTDHQGTALQIKQLMVPVMTILNGDFAYRSMEI